MSEASVKVADSRDKPVVFEGVYRRTSLYQSGVYVGNEHPGIRVIVLHVADSLEAPQSETVQCWTDLLAAPSDLHEGDRLRIEGTGSHLVLTGQQYLAYVGSCRFARK